MGVPVGLRKATHDDDPLSVQVSQRWARRFRCGVRILLVPAALWLLWSLIRFVALHDGLHLDADHTEGVVSLALAVIAFGTLLALEVANPLGTVNGPAIHRRFAVVSVLTSLLCLTGIVVAWFLVYDRTAHAQVRGHPAMNAAAVEDYLRGNLPDGGAGFVRVPTGVFVQSVEFKDTSNVAVSGYVWQRVPDGAKIRPGVVFPEAADAYVARTTPAYKQRENGRTLYGWYFNAEFRQQFDYRSYPLDKQNVWLRMWCADFNEKVALVPDLTAYPPWDVRRMIGMDPLLVYGDWNPDFTAYSFGAMRYSTNFGFGSKVATDHGLPELYFNIGLKRAPQGPLYGQLIRWVFIALIVFAALFLITIDEDRRELVGFTTFEVMSFAVGMLLVIVFDQNAVREATGARGVVYLEYFSYALYAMILLAGLNAMLLTARVDIRALTWGGNLLPKLLYWPCYLILVLVATLLSFFH